MKSASENSYSNSAIVNYLQNDNSRWRMTSSTASINKNRPVPIFLELAFCYFLTWFSLIPKLVTFHPFLNLLIGHVEVAFLFVQRGHLRHLVLSQFEVEHLDILLDMLWIRRAGHYAEALLDVPTDDDLCSALAVSLGNLTYNGIAQDLTLRVTTS